MDSFLLSAIGLGFLGSLHCVGMCGPLVLAVHAKMIHKNELIASLIYHSGRILVYTLLGFLAGSFGYILLNFTYQKAAIIVSSMIILLTGIYPFFNKWNLNTGNKGLFKFIRFENKTHPIFKLFLLGVANGLLPCGFVYLALSGSIGTLSATNGAIFMAIFGLGTFPALLFIGLMGKQLKLKFSIFSNKWIGLAISIILFSILIWRGFAYEIESCCKV